jgi:4-amino-4-deoxy-L-arabinose transferase-like glycosyltransferase
MRLLHIPHHQVAATGAAVGFASAEERNINISENEIPAHSNPAAAPHPARTRDSISYRFLAWGLVALGIVIRLRMYLADRSFWRDEAALALNVIHRSFAGLFQPLDYYQGAAVGFLMFQKLAFTLFGGGEMSMRLWPVIASVLAVPLFYLLCRGILSRRAAVFALAFFALAADKSYYWADCKQYSTDCFLAILLMFLAVRALKFQADSLAADRNRILALGIVGALAIWFSHPAIFVLAGIGVAAAIQWLQDKPHRQTANVFFLAAVWVASFFLNYWFHLRNLTHNDYLQHYWSDIAGAFAPPPVSLGDLTWYKRNFLDLFREFSIEFQGLAALVFIVGAIEVWRVGRQLPALLLTPLAAALVASGLHQYPFEWRLLLFAMPSITMIVAAGLDFPWKGELRVVGVVALCLLLISPINKTINTLHNPPSYCDMRPALEFVAAHYQRGDVFYLNDSAECDFAYYQPRFGLSGAPVTIGSHNFADLNAWAEEFSQFRGKRLWMIDENPFIGDIAGESHFAAEQPLAMSVLDTMGKCLWKKQTFNVYVACYDLAAGAQAEASWLKPFAMIKANE